jgi:hypothetical protein
VVLPAPQSLRQYVSSLWMKSSERSFFTIDGNRIIPDKSMRLLPKELNGAKTGEIDAEGAAYGDGYFYILGSHGLSRKKAEFNPSSFFLFRFPVDEETGFPEFEFSKKKVAPDIERTDALRAILKGAPDPIGQYAEKPLGEGRRRCQHRRPRIP